MHFLPNCRTRSGIKLKYVVGCITDNGSFRFVVSDTGIGISEDNIASVLLPFGQVHDIYTKNHEGTGPGLPLAKRLAEIHDGTLTLTSEVGVGTVVAVDLPAARIRPSGP